VEYERFDGLNEGFGALFCAGIRAESPSGNLVVQLKMTMNDAHF